MKTLTYGQLREMLDRDEDFILINALPAEAFEKEHIPGSLNVPLEEEDFVTQAEELSDGKNAKIVVYCGSSDCPVSRRAAEKLDEAGFTNVHAYEGGMKEWREKAGGQPLSDSSQSDSKLNV